MSAGNSHLPVCNLKNSRPALSLVRLGAPFVFIGQYCCQLPGARVKSLNLIGQKILWPITVFTVFLAPPIGYRDDYANNVPVAIGYCRREGLRPRILLATKRLRRDFATRDEAAVGAHRSVQTTRWDWEETHLGPVIQVTSVVERGLLSSSSSFFEKKFFIPLWKWRTYSPRIEKARYLWKHNN